LEESTVPDPDNQQEQKCSSDSLATRPVEERIEGRCAAARPPEFESDEAMAAWIASQIPFLNTPIRRVPGLSLEQELAVRNLLALLPAEFRLEGLSAADRLRGLTAEEVLRGLSPGTVERLRQLLQQPPHQPESSPSPE
jgi:hypothetical protein